MFNNNLPLVLVVWMMVIAVLAIARKRKHTAGVGLVLAYVLNLWLIHWAASLLYILPWYPGTGEAFTTLGVEQSLYGVAAFAFGSLALTPLVVDSGIISRSKAIIQPDPRLPRAYLITGGIFYLISSTALGRLPTFNAILSGGEQLTVIGLGLCCWQAWRIGNFSNMAFWLAVSFLPPFVTIITRGFIGFGAVATLSVLIFLSNFVRRRVIVVVVGMLLTYGALSVYVTYMRDRDQIRESVWGGQAYSSRFDRLAETAGRFEWFDPFNQRHLERVDQRLNQSYLVGAAIARLEETGDFARGETFWDAAVALVPRILWPDKPVTAGSGNLVSRFTGMNFAGGTSVGIGNVMEFYVNFGTTGVVIGFMIFGVIVTTLDILATERLANGDLHGFVLFYLPGLSFLLVGGQLVEITASAGAAIIVALMANRLLDRLQQSRTGDIARVSSALGQHS